MEYSVTFHNLITTVSIAPSAVSFRQGRFITQPGMHHINRATGAHYLEVKGLEVDCVLDEEPSEGRKILEELEMALYLAEEIMTEVAATYQVECYLERPITCTYNGKDYRLEGSYWHEIEPAVVLRGGQHFADNLSFLNSEHNFHPMFHLYRTAKDESLPNDYRMLNAWRFLEAFHGKRDSELKDVLIAEGRLAEVLINNFYKFYRCAVAHATRLGQDPDTREVIVPRSVETQFDGDVMLRLDKINDYLDEVVESIENKETEIIRWF